MTNRKRYRDLLARANNRGPLSENDRERIFNYLEKPTRSGWSDINAIVINGNAHGNLATRPPSTLWLAVAAVEPGFCDPYVLYRGEKQTPEECRARYPDALLLARAIKAALAPKNCVPHRYRLR